MRSKPPRWAIRNCSEPEDDTDTSPHPRFATNWPAASPALPTAAMIGAFSALRRRSILNSPAPQRRYLGASGSVDHNDLRGWIPATAFTMSIQSMPPGNRIPMHCHETKEISFISRRQGAGAVLGEGERYDITRGRGDLVVLPPFLHDEVFNEGDNICRR